MATDRLLYRYSKEASRLEGDPGGLFRAHDAWEAYREIQCLSAYEDASPGTGAPLAMLGCRENLAKQRLQTVWSLYLEGRDTQLGPPPSP